MASNPAIAIPRTAASGSPAANALLSQTAMIRLSPPMTSQVSGLNILHEDGDLLIVNKPAGLVCHPTKGDAFSSLIGRVRLHVGPDAEAHLINRLDRETSGVVVVAKTAAAAR